MHTAREERMASAQLPQANVVSILYEQHAQLRDQFGVVPDLRGEYRRAAFDMLREMLARHEAAEEAVLLEEQVTMHFVREEAEEFPVVLGELSRHEQEELGRWMLRAIELAPSHPHPTLSGSPVGQAVLGPFASLYDWARDLLRRAREEMEEH
jgi:hypothetical protein